MRASKVTTLILCTAWMWSKRDEINLSYSWGLWDSTVQVSLHSDQYNANSDASEMENVGDAHSKSDVYDTSFVVTIPASYCCIHWYTVHFDITFPSPNTFWHYIPLSKHILTLHSPLQTHFTADNEYRWLVLLLVVKNG